MANTAYATLEIIPSLKGVQGKIEQGLSPASAAGVTAGRSIGGRLVEGVAAVAKVGAVAVGAVLGTALYKGFNRLTAIENATAKLTGLGNSAGTVKTVMNDALKSVKGTAFGLDEAATIAAGAVASGIKPGKDLQRTLGLVGDAATISGVSLGEMGAIFNKVASSNKIQGDVIAQLNDQGIPIIQLLGKQLGKTSAEVTKMASKGKIDFKTFQSAMEAGLGGAALKSGQTLEGSFKNMNAALGRLGATMLKGIYPLAKEVFGGLTVALDDINVMLGPLVDTVSKKLVDGFHKLTPIISDFWAGFTLSDPKSIGAPLEGFVAQGQAVRVALTRVSAAVTGLYSLVINGDFTGALRTAFGWEEDSSAVDQILRIRTAAIGLFDLVVKGDYSGRLREAFGWEEDSTAVDNILRIRDAASGLYDLIVKGDFTSALSNAFHIEEDSQFVGYVLSARDAIKDFFANLNGGGGNAAISGDLSQIGAAAKELGPIFLALFKIVHDLMGALPSLGSILHVVAQGLTFLADHSETLIKLLPFIAAGIVAMKVAEVLYRVNLIASLPIKAAAVVANLVLARSQFVLANALNAVTGASNVSMFAQLRAAIATRVAWVTSAARVIASLVAQAAAFVATRVAMVAGAAATLIMAGAQGALNLALSANPIALVVIALVALVAGLIFAYKNSETFRNIVNKVGTAIKSGFLASLEAVKTAFFTVKDAMSAAGSAISTGWTSTISFFQGVGSFFAGLWAQVVAAFNTGVAFVVSTASRFSGVFNIITQPFQGVAQYFTGLFQILKGIFTGNFQLIGDGIANVIGGIVRTFFGMPARIIAAIIPLLPAIGAFFVSVGTTIWNAVVSAATAVVTFYASIPGRIISAVTSLIVLAGNWARSTWAAISAAMVAGWNAVYAYVTTFPSRFIAGVNVLIGLARGWMTSVWNFVRSAAIAGAGAVVTYVTTLPSRFIAGVNSLISQARAWMASVWSGVSSAVSTGTSSVVSLASGLPGRVLGAVGNLGSTLYSAGTALIDGLKNGITAKLGEALAAARNLAGQITDAVKGALGINSPSRVFMEIGSFTAQGFVKGIEGQAQNVDNAMRNLVTPPPVSSMRGPGVSASGIGGSGASVDQSVNFYGQVGADATEVADRIRIERMKSATVQGFGAMV